MAALRRPQRSALTDLRSWGLLAGAGICATRVIVYSASSEPLPEALRNVATVLPQWVYVLLWAATAGTLTVAAVWQIPARPWHAFVVGMPLLWGCFYAFGTFLGGGEDVVKAWGNAWLWWFVGVRFGITLLMPPGVVRAHREPDGTRR